MKRVIFKCFSVILALSLVLTAFVLVSPKVEAATQEIEFSLGGGFYADAFDLSLSSSFAGAQIYYTLDESTPDITKVGSGTFLYQSPIRIVDRTPSQNIYAPLIVFGVTKQQVDASVNIPKCTVVKAFAVSGNLKSKTVTNSYFVDALKEKKFNLPVFSLTTEPSNLYDSNNGLFMNAALQNSLLETDYEKPLHIEMYDTNGAQIFNQDGAVRLHGNSTKNLAQKTLRLYSNNSLDPINTKFDFEIFPGAKDSDGQIIDSYKRLLLRNSGNDFGSTMMRDAFNQILVKDLNIDIQNYRPAIAYVCGEYYGIVNIRERLDNYYVQEHYPVDKNDVVLIQDPGPNGGQLDEGVPGDQASYVNLHSFIDSADLNVKANLDFVNGQFDLSCLQDYFAMENFIDNTDWPVKNVRIWRSKQAIPIPGEKGADGRWRYMLCDTDISTDMWSDPVASSKSDSFAFVMDSVTGFPASKRIFQKLMNSELFKQQFLRNYVKIINNTYNIKKVKKLMQETRDRIIKAVPYSNQRYIYNLPNIYGSTNNLLKFYTLRGDNVLSQMSTRYGLGNVLKLIVNNAATNLGNVTVDDMKIEGYMLDGNSYTSKYFRNFSVNLSVAPKAGYNFSRWLITENGMSRYSYNPQLTLDFLGGTDITVNPEYSLSENGVVVAPSGNENFPSVPSEELVGDNFDNHVLPNSTTNSSLAWTENYSSGSNTTNIAKGVGVNSTNAMNLKGNATITNMRQIIPYAAGQYSKLSVDIKTVTSGTNGIRLGLTAVGASGETYVSPEALVLNSTNNVAAPNFMHYEKYLKIPDYTEIKTSTGTSFFPEYFSMKIATTNGEYLIDNIQLDLMNSGELPPGVTPTPSPVATPIPTQTPIPTPTPTPTPSPTPTPKPTPTPSPTPTPTPYVGPVFASDSTLICDGAPSGMKVVYEDTNDGFVTATLKLRGQMTINGFNISLKYDKAQMMPVTVANPRTDVPNSKLTTAAELLLYYQNLAANTYLNNFLVGPYQLDNTTGVSGGNYIHLGFGKGNGAVNISLNGNTEVSVLKFYFRKISPSTPLTSNALTFNYNTGIVKMTSKMAYLSTSINQYPANTGMWVFQSPALFTMMRGYSVKANCPNATDLMESGDAGIDSYFNDLTATKIVVKPSYLSALVLETVFVDPVTKVGNVSGLPDGNYVASISRKGYLVRDIAVTVTGGSINLGDKVLIPGDLVVDGAIDVSDLGVILSAFASTYGDENYTPVNDLNVDGSVDVADLGMLLAYFGNDITSYNENVNYNS